MSGYEWLVLVIAMGAINTWLMARNNSLNADVRYWRRRAEDSEAVNKVLRERAKP